MLSVLVVNADRSFLDLFQKTAGTWPDVEVATACCAKEAGDYLGDHPCDVVISGYMLPDRDGISSSRDTGNGSGETG
jgi:DNA-binding response OmpR family regulator